jgi:hypothetical protein
MEHKRCLEENEREKAYGYIGNQDNFVKHNKTNFFVKWTDGQPYERTRRMNHQIQIENNEFSKKMETTAYSSSLNHDENTWEILNQSLSSSAFKVSNKREELGDKLANREMIQQIGFNPFLAETNYVDDISIRDKFLKPINTNEEDKN